MAAERFRFSPAEIERYYSYRVSALKWNGSGEARGPCPIHQGESDSFAVNSKTGEWYCHSECGRGGSILDLEMALSESDFKAAKLEVLRVSGRVARSVTADAAKRGTNPKGSKRFRRLLGQRIQKIAKARGLRHVSNYPYTEEDGNLAYVKVKFRDAESQKTFLKFAPTPKGGLTTPKLVGIPPMLYNFHLLADAREIHLCNGEKAANAGRKLGLVTTCLPDGEAHWDKNFTKFFEDKSVVAYLDNDAKGNAHGRVVARALFGHASEVRLVRLPDLPEKGDLYDWIKAGGTVGELRTIIDATAVVDTKPDAPANGRPSKSTGAPGANAFHLMGDSVLYIDPDPDREPMRICGRLEVAALTRDGDGDAWGRLLKWPDAESREHQWAMPMSLLSGDGSEYRARLLNGGLFIAPGRKARELLTVYIQTAQPKARALCVSRVGWHGDNFVLPGENIGPSGAEAVLFQTQYESGHLFKVSGTLENWQNNVGRLCSGNSRLILAVSCALAGPTLALMGAESGGVHLIGPSSTGKSTALIVGGSICGGGGQAGFVQSWRTTINGLEAVAAHHNDGTLFIDELSQVDPREATATAYLLGNGLGKIRMSRTIGLRKKLTWNLLYMSAGEITLAEHAASAGARTRGGAEVRLLNIAADAGAEMGMFENLHGIKSADAFARKLKRMAQRYYGSPLHAWLKVLTNDLAAAKDSLKEFRLNFLKKHLPLDASGEVSRAAQRFALIGAAGELATAEGITGWTRGECSNAAGRCFHSWVGNRGTTGGADMEAAVRQIRTLLQAHGVSRLPLIQHDGTVDKDRVVRDQAGFRRNTKTNRSEFLIFSEIFKTEFCKGYSWQAVAKELFARGFLRRVEPHMTIKVRLPGMKTPVRLYCVREAILRGDES